MLRYAAMEGRDGGEGLARLAGLLAERGELYRVTRVLLTPADDSRWYSTQMAWFLVIHGDLDQLRARAGTGDEAAARWLAEQPPDSGDLHGLTARADAGDAQAARQLNLLLTARGDLEGLRARADAGDTHAATVLTHLLARLLTMQGRGEEAERFRRFGLNPDGSIACADAA